MGISSTLISYDGGCHRTAFWSPVGASEVGGEAESTWVNIEAMNGYGGLRVRRGIGGYILYWLLKKTIVED